MLQFRLPQPSRALPALVPSVVAMLGAALIASALPLVVQAQTPAQGQVSAQPQTQTTAQPQNSAPSQAPSLSATRVRVDAPWVRATVPHQPATGAFMQLQSQQTLKLVAADSPVAKTVELHEMRMEDDIMRMRQVSEVELPAGETVALQPGGYHIMLIGLHQQVKAGEQVPITLTLETAEGKRYTLEVNAEVRALNAGAPSGHGHGQHSVHPSSHSSHSHPAEPMPSHGGHVHPAESSSLHGSHSHHGEQMTPQHDQTQYAQPASVAQRVSSAAEPALPSSVSVQDCWVRTLPLPLPAAAYLTIHNQGDEDVVLQKAMAPGYARTMLHSTVTEDGMARMEHQEQIRVPAGETVVLAPGGLHIMLEQAEQALTVGSTLPLSLQFQGYTAPEVQCEVRSARG